MIHTWKAPIDEALGIPDFTPVEGPLSMGRLALIGVDKAIAELRTHRHESHRVPEAAPGDASMPDELDGQARYRMSGRWLGSSGRKEKFLTSLSEMSDSFRAFVDAATSTGADTILDIASGGGSGICCIASVLDSSRRIFAAERDYKCLWSIQSKFDHLGRGETSEAVGADVRRLPFPDGSIDLVTSVAALPEVKGISEVLSEVSRVLIPGGKYLAIYNPEPDTYGIVPIEDYTRFAREADLFSGHDDFLDAAEEAGLVAIRSSCFEEASRRRTVTILRKR